MARTIRFKVYKFDELGDEAKKVAIQWYKDLESEVSYIFDEAYESVEAFAKLFDIAIRSFDFLEPYRNEYRFNMEDRILELSGQRLATYIWNNYKDNLYKGKWYNSWTTKHKVKHRKVKSIMKSKETGWSDPKQQGEYWNEYRGLTLEHSCVFTGVCYDEDILEPIYKFLDKPDDRDFKQLLKDCFKSICKSLDGEYEARQEDDYITEQIKANEYEFTKSGKRFNNK